MTGVKATLCGLTMSLMCVAATGASAATVGFSSTARTQQDNAAQYVGVIDQAFPTAGQVASSFSYYNVNPAATVVPLLFTRVGDTFTVTAIGTGSTGQPVGAVSAMFGLTSGSAVVTAVTYGGFESFGDTIPFDYSSAVPGTYLFVGPLALGTSFVATSTTSQMDMLNVLNNRNYSFSITSTPAVNSPPPVPEPASLAILALGLVAIGATRSVRRSSPTSAPR